MADLQACTEGWAPAPTETTGATSAWATGAFAGLLDLDPVVGEGGALPPLWHWLGFAEHSRQDELGDDGHELDGHFLPPIPQRRRMHAGGRLEVHAPMRVGETVARRSSISRSEVKHGRSGEMLLVTTRHEFSREGSVLAVEEQDFVYRSQEPGQARGIAFDEPGSPHHDPPLPGSEAVTVRADETLLFRFSALTYNTHRIHYDQPYVTAVEGYPGLVVHGPLLALLALELPRRHRPDRRVTRLDYRLRRPSFVTGAQTRIVADVAPANAGGVDGSSVAGSDDGLAVTVGVPGAPPSLTATITLVEETR